MTSLEHPDKDAPTGDQSAPLEAGEYPTIVADLYCTECGYNLRGLTSNRCPECGCSLEELRSAVSGIPWVHRRHLGLCRAYWKTVWLVTAREKRFCTEIVRPVDYADSQRFRRLTILHVYLPILLGTIALYLVEPSGPFGDPFIDAAFVAIWPVAVFHILLFVYLIAATGVPSYFFHPRSLPIHLQNRAIAMSYYACGPLAFAALPVGAILAAVLADSNHVLAQVSFWVAVSLVVLLASGWWLLLVAMAKRIVPERAWWKYAVGVGVPVLWIIAFGLILAVPAGVAFLVIVVASLG